MNPGSMAKETQTMAKEAYLMNPGSMAKETQTMAKEAYTMAKEAYTMATETCTRSLFRIPIPHPYSVLVYLGT